MPPLVATRSLSFRPLPPLRRLLTIAALASVHALPSRVAHAQEATLNHTDDALPIPGGWVRLSVGNIWERYDTRFGESAVFGIGDELSTDSLGPRQLPGLSPIEGGLQTLTKNPAQRLTFGRLAVRSDARIVTTPIALEYGITRRLSLGVVVPIVQTRRTAQVLVNQRAPGDTTKTSNVGIFPESQRAAQAALNKRVFDNLTNAATGLSGLLTRCTQNPLAAECDPIRGKETAAAAAALQATQFAGAVSVSYGINAQTAVVAPLAGSSLAKTVASQLAALQAQLATYIPGTVLDTLSTARTEFSYIDLQGRAGTPGLLQSELGGGLDSIATTERLGLGDIELRARVLLLERLQPDTLRPRSLQYRLGVSGIVRFATSRPDSATNLIDIGTGEGAGVEVRAALEMSKRRLGATVAAGYAKYFARTVNVPLVGYPIAGYPYPQFGEVSRTAGTVLGIDATPRFYFSEWLALEGHYGYEHTGAPTFTGAEPSPCSSCTVLPNSILPAPWTVQRIGFGVRFSTVESFLRRRARYPIVVSWRHVETITGDAGAPKQFFDQIQLRLFYRIRG